MRLARFFRGRIVEDAVPAYTAVALFQGMRNCAHAGPAALAGCLTELLAAGSSVWRGFAKRGRQTLRAQHTKPAVVSDYLSMYEELLAGGGCAGFTQVPAKH